MTDQPRLHLIIDHPAPGEWHGRLDVLEALEAAGWTADEDMPLSIVRHPSGAVWSVVNESDDSGLDCPNGTVVEFPGSTPTVVIVAACLAAAQQECRRSLSPNEYSAAWHAVEGAAGEPGADPATVLHAVLRTLGIDQPAAEPAARYRCAAGHFLPAGFRPHGDPDTWDDTCRCKPVS